MVMSLQEVLERRFGDDDDLAAALVEFADRTGPLAVVEARPSTIWDRARRPPCAGWGPRWHVGGRGQGVLVWPCSWAAIVAGCTSRLRTWPERAWCRRLWA